MSNKFVFSQLLKGEYYQQNGQNIFVHMDKDKEPSSIYKWYFQQNCLLMVPVESHISHFKILLYSFDIDFFNCKTEFLKTNIQILE